MKRGERYFHNHFISPADNQPQLIEVTRTKRYTNSDGEDSIMVYWRPIVRYSTGREVMGASYWTDIHRTGGWKPAT